jgi:hypothetical protein
MTKLEEIKAIVTMPPYAPYMDEVLKHPAVSGIRLNTVMPYKGSLDDLLKSLLYKCNEESKDLWIDLKCRQLRIADYGVPPFTEIRLSHEIELKTPAKAYFSDRYECATILEVDGNRLIMQEGPKRVVGPGESLTIPEKSLVIKGYLTELDKKYIESGNKIGLANYMLSFVEQKDDISEFRKYSDAKNLVAKIESVKGLDYSINKDKDIRLMAARGDLYMQLFWPHEIIVALENILKKDDSAIVASRILGSMAEQPEPSSGDIGDLDNLLRMGYKNYMFGDEVCLKRSSIISALNVFNLMKKRYEGDIK